MKTVAIESPFAGDEARNLEYLKRCVADCLAKKESPYASHAFFPQFLNDNLQSERKLGIEAGFDWSDKADRIAFYVDYGMSIGMIGALQHYVSKGITNYEFRYIGTNESVAPNRRSEASGILKKEEFVSRVSEEDGLWHMTMACTETCLRCNGLGRDSLGYCSACGGLGKVKIERAVSKPEYPHWRGGDNVKTPEERRYEAQLTPDTMLGA